MGRWKIQQVAYLWAAAQEFEESHIAQALELLAVNIWVAKAQQE